MLHADEIREVHSVGLLEVAQAAYAGKVVGNAVGEFEDVRAALQAPLRSACISSQLPSYRLALQHDQHSLLAGQAVNELTHLVLGFGHFVQPEQNVKDRPWKTIAPSQLDLARTAALSA